MFHQLVAMLLTMSSVSTLYVENENTRSAVPRFPATVRQGQQKTVWLNPGQALFKPTTADFEALVCLQVPSTYYASCKSNGVQTSDCAILTSDCECYNWAFSKSSNATVASGESIGTNSAGCVNLIVREAGSTLLRYSLVQTDWPVLPLGWESAARVRYNAWPLRGRFPYRAYRQRFQQEQCPIQQPYNQGACYADVEMTYKAGTVPVMNEDSAGISVTIEVYLLFLFLLVLGISCGIIYYQKHHPPHPKSE